MTDTTDTLQPDSPKPGKSISQWEMVHSKFFLFIEYSSVAGLAMVAYAFFFVSIADPLLCGLFFLVALARPLDLLVSKKRF